MSVVVSLFPFFERAPPSHIIISAVVDSPVRVSSEVVSAFIPEFPPFLMSVPVLGVDVVGRSLIYLNENLPSVQFPLAQLSNC